MRGWNKKGKEKVILLFAIVSVISLISTMSASVSADEIDDLLSKTKSAPNPKPSVMVTSYALSPETLMPGDIGVLTITLENIKLEVTNEGISEVNSVAVLALEEQSGTSFSAITSTPTPTSSSSLTQALKLPGVGIAFVFAGLLPVAYLLLLRRKRKGSGEE